MDIQIVLTTVLVVLASISGLGYVFNLLLKPVKENQVRTQSDLKEVKEDLKDFKKDFKDLNYKVDKLLLKTN